jgi:hypothetical protein
MHRAQVGSSGGDFPFQNSSNQVFRVSRHLGRQVADWVVCGRGVEIRLRAKSIVAKIRNWVSIKPSANSIYFGNGSGTTMVAHKQLLRDLTIMIKTQNSTHGSENADGIEIIIRKTVWINATDITDGSQHLPG